MKAYYKIVMFFLLVCLGEEVLARVVNINAFRFSIEPNKVRLVFDVTGPINYTATQYPEKIVIDVKQAKLTTLLNKPGLSKTPVGSILNAQNKNDVRLILHLKNPVKLQHFLLSKPDRLILDLFSEEKEVEVILKPSASTLLLPENAKTPTSVQTDASDSVDDLERDLIEKMYTSNENKASWREIVIVIDPGHGGKDSGAVGRRGTYEKDVNLAVAKALRNTINNNKGFRAILTRNSDYFIPLRKRLAIAHSHKADMFISIHSDAYINRDAHGASVFALSQRGATSEAARWLAEKENESELGQAIFDKNMLLRSVLIDLAQTASISASLDLGNKILQQLVSLTCLHSRRVEQAAFVVLKSPDIPSLLVEIGFISNDGEESRLRNSQYQKEIAFRLASGIRSYFIKRPPSGTYLAQIKPRQLQRSTVTLGDVLPGQDS